MADGTLQLNPATIPGGQLEDIETLVGAGGADVLRQRLQVTGATLAEIARVLNVSPTWLEYALAVRTIPPRTSTEPSLSQALASIVASTILSANTARKGATFQTQSISGGSNLYLRLGAGASPVNYHVLLVPGAYYELPQNPLYTGDVTAVWDGAVGYVNVGEVT